MQSEQQSEVDFKNEWHFRDLGITKEYCILLIRVPEGKEREW